MKVEDKDYLMDEFAKRAKEHPQYDDYYINLTDLESIVDDFVSNRLEKLVMPTKERTKYLIVARISSWETKEYWYEFDDYNEALKELKEKREGFTSNVEIDFYEAHPIIGKI